MITSAKRLLQHNRGEADSTHESETVNLISFAAYKVSTAANVPRARAALVRHSRLLRLTAAQQSWPQQDYREAPAKLPPETAEAQ